MAGGQSVGERFSNPPRGHPLGQEDLRELGLPFGRGGERCGKRDPRPAGGVELGERETAFDERRLPPFDRGPPHELGRNAVPMEHEPPALPRLGRLDRSARAPVGPGMHVC